MSEHGSLTNFYRVYSTAAEDIDLTRAQAIRLYQQLRDALWPRSVVPKKRTKKLKRSAR